MVTTLMFLAVNAAGKESRGEGKGKEDKGKETVKTDGEGCC